ncbi:GTPase HflX [Collinsella tanakaei]|nr:GTPase HflX [Collinsella tanakaei]
MARFTFLSTSIEPERALLVGVEWRTNAWPVERSLDELERLAGTAGAEVVGRLTQRLERPVPKSFIGSGKVQELKDLVSRLDVDVVIFDDDLTPAQQSHLEKTIGEPTKIIDRTALILDIFGLHAKTREGRLQVQLAQLQYLLPRLRGMWSHLAKEQTRGGIGSRFGQGESQLEVDRRLIRNRISALRRELKELEKRREVQSKHRVESDAFRVALAGYTNAGKSTLLNTLTGAGVLSEDKLFATLDPTTRSYVLPGGRSITITDTVGFIQKLPHGLVEAFKSTLSEVRGADLILKVVDVADEDRERHLEAVDRVLDEIGAGERPSLTVYNKADLLDAHELETLRVRMPQAVFFSARTALGLEQLLDRLAAEAAATDRLISAEVPYREGSLMKVVREQGQVLSEEYLEDRMRIVAKVPERIAARLQRYTVE